MAFCTSCGTAVVPGSRFCIACGSPLHATDSTQPSQQLGPPNSSERKVNVDTVRMFTFLAAGLSLVGGLLAAAALFLPSSNVDRLWYFWSWRAEFLRWDLVGSVLPLFVAGTLALTLGRTTPRWALGCTAAATFAVARAAALWIQSSEYDGFFHAPSDKSLVLLVALAAAVGSAALAVTVVVRSDPPPLRIHSRLVTRALVTGAFLAIANTVALQWISPPGNFFSVYTIGFHTGVPIALVVTSLAIALLYAVVLVAGAMFGPEAGAAVAATIGGAWIAYLADGLRGLGRAYEYRTSTGIGFILALVAGVLLALFLKRTVSSLLRSNDERHEDTDNAFPFVAAARTIVAMVGAYLLLSMPLHMLTTGYTADGRTCDTPIDSALSREYRTREIGGSIDPITNEWTNGRRVRSEISGPCKDAAPKRILVAGFGIVAISGFFIAAWIATPRLIGKIEVALQNGTTTSA